ncbi:MAG: DUF1189 family protein [bacterium]|nr:DUF1189 family protein [bacterium]
MPTPPTYSPGFLQSLIKCCYSSEFYQKVKDIRLGRSVVFLFLLSFFTALAVGLLLITFFRNLDLNPDRIKEYYDTYVPAFEATFDGETLSTEPSHFGTYFLEGGRGLEIVNEKTPNADFTFEVDSGRDVADVVADAPVPYGIYAFRDGVYVSDMIQSRAVKYSEMELQLPASFTITGESIGEMLKGLTPMFLDILWKIVSLAGLAVTFLYLFLGGWIKAVLFSLLGIPILAIMRKELHYGFLIRLSFYASVPALLFWVITFATSTTVPFLPTLVFLGYYGYGLSAYRTASAKAG